MAIIIPFNDSIKLDEVVGAVQLHPKRHFAKPEEIDPYAKGHKITRGAMPPTVKDAIQTFESYDEFNSDRYFLASQDNGFKTFRVVGTKSQGNKLHPQTIDFLVNGFGQLTEAELAIYKVEIFNTDRIQAESWDITTKTSRRTDVEKAKVIYFPVDDLNRYGISFGLLDYADKSIVRLPRIAEVDRCNFVSVGTNKFIEVFATTREPITQGYAFKHGYSQVPSKPGEEYNGVHIMLPLLKGEVDPKGRIVTAINPK